jgi:excisionase family DNA binding protein
MDNNKQFLTTTQAARILSVSPDTVLKWVKAGKLSAHRTLGGHYRIPHDALQVQSEKDIGLVSGNLQAVQPAHQYCWEFHSVDGSVSSECLKCITYRSRSRRCYEFADLPEGIGFLHLNCKTTCDECEFFQLVSEQSPNILVCSESDGIIRDRDRIDTCESMNIRVVGSEYECATVMESFRPDFIVVDCAIGGKRSRRLCSSLYNDSRIPVTRIILSSRTKQLKDYCENEVFAWIRKPFTTQQLRECTEGVF